MALFLALAAAAGSDGVDENLMRMVSLYDEVCLHAFPEDDAVVALLKERGAQEMSAQEVKVTMNDDPARGWRLPGESTTVWLEFPPFHACSVRWNAPRMPDIQPYITVRDAYAKANAREGSITEKVFDQDVNQVHIKASMTAFGRKADQADESAESLLFIEQSINNEGRRAIGETGYVLRFVHQAYDQTTATSE
jgi:hypothetical protein